MKKLMLLGLFVCFFVFTDIVIADPTTPPPPTPTKGVDKPNVTNTPAPQPTNPPAATNTPAPDPTRDPSCSSSCQCGCDSLNHCNTCDGGGGGNGGGGSGGGGNAPAVTATPVPPTPTPTRAPAPPVIGPVSCTDYGWRATLTWTKSPDTAVSNYVLRLNYKDSPAPQSESWFVSDGTDFVKTTGNVATTTLDVLPNRFYIDWSITSWISATNMGDLTSRATKTFASNEYFCKQTLPTGTACTLGITGNNICTVDVWIDGFKAQNGYINTLTTGLVADVSPDGTTLPNGIIGLADYEKIRQENIDKAPTPTIAPTVTPTNTVISPTSPLVTVTAPPLTPSTSPSIAPTVPVTQIPATPTPTGALPQ